MLLVFFIKNVDDNRHIIQGLIIQANCMAFMICVKNKQWKTLQTCSKYHDVVTRTFVPWPICQDSTYFSSKCHQQEMETYPLLLLAIYVSSLFWFLHYSYPRNLFARTLKPRLSASVSVCIFFFRLLNLPVMLKNSFGGPNAPTSHACKKDRLMPFQNSPVFHDAMNSQTGFLGNIS